MSKYKTSDIIYDRYRILAEPKEGRTSLVYRCWDNKTNRTVALRIFKSRKGIQRMESAIEILKGLHHPNVLRILDFFKINNTCFQVEEFLDGKTLEEMMQSGVCMTVAKAVDYICQILDGLSYIHGKNIVHKDINPDKVFVLSDGSIKITGFGFSKSNNYAVTKSVKSASAAFGFPQYMSPERFDGESSPVSDIYSVALVMYEMLTGKNPFDLRNKKEIIRLQKEFIPSAPSAFNSMVPSALDSVILSALSKDKENRPGNAKEFKQMLKKASHQKVSKRRLLILELILLAGLAGVVAFIIYSAISI